MELVYSALFPALSFAQPATRYYGKPLTSQTQRFPTYAGPYRGAMPRPTSPPQIEPPHHRPPPHHPPHGGYPNTTRCQYYLPSPQLLTTYSQETNSYVYGDGGL